MAQIMDRLRELKYKYATPPPTLQVFFGDRQVAELQKERGRFSFRYLDTFSEMCLSPIPGFPEVSSKHVYSSDHLFPFFSERIPDRGRPEIQQLIKQLRIKQDDELQLLADLSRHSVTDPFELKLARTAAG
jgi:HipA-like protein